jgi:hypothetical protein
MYADHQEALHKGARFCYLVDTSSVFHEGKGWVPSLVTEDTEGHSPMLGNGPFATPWYWGLTLESAQAVCEDQNRKLGLSKMDVMEIIGSSMRLTMGRR